MYLCLHNMVHVSSIVMHRVEMEDDVTIYSRFALGGGGGLVLCTGVIFEGIYGAFAVRGLYMYTVFSEIVTLGYYYFNTLWTLTTPNITT